MNGLSCKFKVCCLLHKDWCSCCQTTGIQYYRVELIYFRLEMQVFGLTREFYRNTTSLIQLRKRSTYVTIFLSKKYWSFLAPMTLRSETSSLSILRKQKPVNLTACSRYVWLIQNYYGTFYQNWLKSSYCTEDFYNTEITRVWNDHLFLK